MEPMSQEEYVKEDGWFCPFCRSGHITAISEISGGYQQVKCNDCQKEWDDVYNLVGYEERSK